MNIVMQRTINEILVRFTDTGAYSGSHVRELERVVDTDSGTVFAAKLLDPRGISTTEVGQYLGAQNAEMIESLDAETARANAAEALLATAQGTIAVLQAEIATLRERLATVALALSDLPAEGGVAGSEVTIDPLAESPIEPSAETA